MQDRQITMVNFIGGGMLLAVSVFIITVVGLGLANGQATRPRVVGPVAAVTAVAKKEAVTCGATTKAGHPCKRRVKAQGDRCPAHRDSK